MPPTEKRLVGELGQRSIIDVIREIYTRKLSGVLMIEKGENRRKFYFVTGELHLSGTHGLAQRLTEYLEVERKLREQRQSGSERTAGVPGLDDSARAAARRQLEHLVRRIVEVLVEWREGRYSFEDDLSALPVDLIGPLPTAYLIMEGAVSALDQEELLAMLGGEEALLVARTDSELTGLFGIDPEEMFLMSRAEQPISVAELLRQVSIDRAASTRKLCRLYAIGLLEGLKRSSSEPDEERLVDSVVERFSSRIEERLRSRPVELGREEHRQKVAELLSDAGGKSHYELLGVGVHASEGDVYDAYDQLGRMVHPSHADHLGLKNRDAGLRLLFERATVAYLTLADPERRASYNLQAGVDPSRMVSAGQRSEEQRRIARETFEKAQERAEAEDFHFALELVQQAVLSDPQAEYYALKGRIEARNPHWLQLSAESFRHALRLDPSNVDYRVALGQVMEEAGDKNSARMHYRVALRERPSHPEAAQGLKRVGAADPAGSTSAMLVRPRPPQRGFFARLKSLFGG